MLDALPVRPSLLNRPISLYPDRRLLDPVVLDWSARGGVADAPTLLAMSNFFQGLRSDGLLMKVLRLNLMVGSTLASGLLPQIVGTGGSTDVNTNFVAGDYGPTTGLTGNTSSKYLDLGGALETQIGGITTGGFGFSMRTPTTFTSTRYPIGSTDGTHRYEVRQSTTAYSGVWGGSGTTTPVTGALPAGVYHLDRSSTTNLVLYLNGSSVSVRATSTTSVGNGLSMFLFANNVSGTASGFCDAALTGYWFTSTLSSGEVSAFYARLQVLLAALGRQV